MSGAGIVMGIAAVVSSLGAQIKLGNEFFFNSLNVLPNYIYWSSLVIGIGNIALKVTKLINLYKLIFWGVLSTIITYHFLLKINYK